MMPSGSDKANTRTPYRPYATRYPIGVWAATNTMQPEKQHPGNRHTALCRYKICKKYEYS